jgi:hypothetical protein
MIDKIINKLFCDKNNNLVLWQFPNPPIIGWFVFMVVAYFIPSGILKTGFASLSSAFLFLWAYLEITQGVNYFRRLLGVIIMLAVVFGYFAL